MSIIPQAPANNHFQFEGHDFFAFVGEDSELHFYAAEACKILEIKNSRDALSRLDDDEKGVASTDTLGGRQNVATITLPGLLKLISTSRIPKAKIFDRWVRHEVVPSVLRTGAYSVQAAPPSPPWKHQVKITPLGRGLIQLEQQQAPIAKTDQPFVTLCLNCQETYPEWLEECPTCHPHERRREHNG